jgi:hypothetical protein
MVIKIKNIVVYVFYHGKGMSWWTFTLFGVSYDDHRAFEIRPFHWGFGASGVVYGHYALGLFHIWL